MVEQTEVLKLLKSLSKHMRQRRKSLGITQEQLADRAGLTPNYVARLEMEKRLPSFTVLVALASALEMPVSELLLSDAGEPAADEAKEMARIMSSLEPEDIEFVLNNLRMVVGYVKHLRFGEEVK